MLYFSSYFLTIICIKYRCMDIYLCDFICMYPVYMYTCVLCWFNMCCFDWYAVIDLLDLKVAHQTAALLPHVPAWTLRWWTARRLEARLSAVPALGFHATGTRSAAGKQDAEWSWNCGENQIPAASNPDSESVSAKSKCFKSEGCPSKDSIDWGSHYSGQVDRSSG